MAIFKVLFLLVHINDDAHISSLCVKELGDFLKSFEMQGDPPLQRMRIACAKQGHLQKMNEPLQD